MEKKYIVLFRIIQIFKEQRFPFLDQTAVHSLQITDWFQILTYHKQKDLEIDFAAKISAKSGLIWHLKENQEKSSRPFIS
jgi:hypothetical protein